MKIRALTSTVALLVLSVRGQSPDPPDFEVASVKRAISRPSPLEALLGREMDDERGFQGGPGTTDPDRINYHGVTLRALLARAYGVKQFQISGPGWIASERYTIVANVEHGTDAERLRLMLQRLLAERFQLSLHRETRVMPVYRLSVTANGSKLKPVHGEPPVYKDDAERRAAVQANMTAMLESANAEREKQDRGANGAGFSLFRATTAELAQKLSSRLDRPVVDTTQLQGLYDIVLNWAEDASHSSEGGSTVPSGPSIFSAIQE